jgi:hypothetical protein
MSIRQINASYLVNEDRILFRFNTLDQAEYRLWFTRRVALFILAATSHLLTKKLEQTHTKDAAKALNEFGKQSILETVQQQKDASKDFESGTSFPIGADPLLVMDVTCSLAKNGEKLAFVEKPKAGGADDAISIDFLLPGGANLNLKLPENLMQGMAVLLDQIRQNAGWGEAILQVKNLPNREQDNEQAEDQNLDAQSSKNISIH